MNNVFSPTPCPLYHIFIPHLYTTWSLRNVIIKLLICCFVHLTFLQTSVYQVDPNLVVPNLSWIAITTVRNTCAIIQSFLRHHSVETYTHISYLHSQPVSKNQSNGSTMTHLMIPLRNLFPFIRLYIRFELDHSETTGSSLLTPSPYFLIRFLMTVSCNFLYPLCHNSASHHH